MTKKRIEMPRFRNESAEADWWASPAGREFVIQRSRGVRAASGKVRGLKLVENLKKRASVQIALRLPESDLAQARKIAERKGIGYQTLLKMLVREGLIREARRG